MGKHETVHTLPPATRLLNGAERAEAPEGALAPPASSSPAQGQPERQESALCAQLMMITFNSLFYHLKLDTLNSPG